MQADCLESQLRDMLRTQEGMDLCLEQRDEELRQLRSQSQSDEAQLAALCHGMTFSDLSFHPFTSSFIVLGLISLLLLTFTLWT